LGRVHVFVNKAESMPEFMQHNCARVCLRKRYGHPAEIHGALLTVDRLGKAAELGEATFSRLEGNADIALGWIPAVVNPEVEAEIRSSVIGPGLGKRCDTLLEVARAFHE
jgi:hypothetical protein